MAEKLVTQVKNPDEQSQASIQTASSKKRSRASLFLSKFFFCVPIGGGDSHSKHSSPVASATSLDSLPKVLKAAPSRKAGKALLKPLLPEDVGKKCLVLDMDETLIHSSFKPVNNADIIIPVEIEGQTHSVYVLKRPGVDTFMERVGTQFEVVIFTASLSKYANPVMDALDKTKTVRHRLFREACINHRGSYVKDLSMLGRDIKDVIIIDNAPVSYMFHPNNAIPITSWFNDPHDTELLDLIPFLEDLKTVDNVTTVLDFNSE